MNYVLWAAVGAALTTLAPTGARAQSSFVLKGQLAPGTGPATVYVRREGPYNGAITDSAVVKNGVFQLRGTLPEPVRAQLVLVRPGQRRRLLTGQADHCTFYLEKGPLTLSSPDSLAHARVTGAGLNADNATLQQQLQPAQAPYEALLAEYRATDPAKRASTGIVARLDAQQPITEAASRTIVTQFVQSHPASLVSLDAIRELGGPIPTYASLGPLYAQLTPALRATPQGQQLGQQVAALQRVAVGAVAPAFTLPTPDNKPVSLADYRGRYVLVDFWASWCGPCRRENPQVVQLYQQFKARNFDIVSISLDAGADRAKWLRAVQDDHLPWTQLWTPDGWNAGVAPLYNVQAIPQNFLLDPQGVIVATNLHGDELRATLARVLPTQAP